MATRTDKQPNGRCCECAHGSFDMQFKNLSLTGEPTLVVCPFTQFKHVVGETACEKFIRQKF